MKTVQRQPETDKLPKTHVFAKSAWPFTSRLSLFTSIHTDCRVRERSD